MARALMLLGSGYGAFVALVWIPWRLGLISLTTVFSPHVWLHHEILFGAGAALATGAGGLVLVALWLAGRAAVYFGGALPPLAWGAALLAFPVAAALLGSGRRRLVLLALAAGQAAFLWEVWRFDASGYGLALGLAAAGAAALTGSFDRSTALATLFMAAAAYGWGVWAPDRYVGAAAWEVALWGLVGALALRGSDWRRGAVLLAAAVPIALALQPGWLTALAPLGGIAWAAAAVRR